MIGAKRAFDFSYTNLIVSICGLFNPHDVRVVGGSVIPWNVADLSIGVDPCAHMYALSIRRQRTHNLRKVTFEVNRVAATVRLGAIY